LVCGTYFRLCWALPPGINTTEGPATMGAEITSAMISCSHRCQPVFRYRILDCHRLRGQNGQDCLAGVGHRRRQTLHCLSGGNSRGVQDGIRRTQPPWAPLPPSYCHARLCGWHAFRRWGLRITRVLCFGRCHWDAAIAAAAVVEDGYVAFNCLAGWSALATPNGHVDHFGACF
jgi:hypothetical protein